MAQYRVQEKGSELPGLLTLMGRHLSYCAHPWLPPFKRQSGLYPGERSHIAKMEKSTQREILLKGRRYTSQSTGDHEGVTAYCRPTICIYWIFTALPHLASIPDTINQRKLPFILARERPQPQPSVWRARRRYQPIGRHGICLPVRSGRGQSSICLPLALPLQVSAHREACRWGSSWAPGTNA